ncbi:MAG: GNAT family N-acetyltransferase [Chitinispirillales bacterium]|jgi:GNAT superfamily N-acetyltransferase|nr:GNAT family N-acetyltransferase [Chitinispirillales bacterium]
MNKQYVFGQLELERLDEALTLIRNVFYEYEAPEYSDEGVEEFMRFLTLENYRDMIKQDKIHFWTCENNGKTIGVLGARFDRINLLFVNGHYHRKGIARRLLEMMIEHFNPAEITVNSSPYAVEAYRKLGFIITDTEKTKNGIRFTPMKRIL